MGGLTQCFLTIQRVGMWGWWEGRSRRSGLYLGLIHIVLWQKPTQHCKAIILQLKINLKNHFPRNVWVYVWTLNSILLAYTSFFFFFNTSIFMPVPHGADYGSSTVVLLTTVVVLTLCSKFWNWEVLVLLFFLFQIALALLITVL